MHGPSVMLKSQAKIVKSESQVLYDGAVCHPLVDLHYQFLVWDKLHSNFGCFYHYYCRCPTSYCAHGPSAPPNHCFTEALQDRHNGLPHMRTLAQGLE